MRFGMFYEHQLPRPWEAGAEQKLIQDAARGYARERIAPRAHEIDRDQKIPAEVLDVIVDLQADH